MTLLQLFRPSDCPARRPQGRRPLVEGLEGRQLLSGVVGNHIGTSAMFAGAPVGSHIGTSAMVQGGHPGMGVADIIAIL
jgi:hypothetical protein